MSLITRCPACGTMFKVVADQLKVSQGWVRCGQCSEVFDASLHLQVDMLAEPAASPVPLPAAAPSQAATGEGSSGDSIGGPSSSFLPSSASYPSSPSSGASQWPPGLQADSQSDWSPGAGFADRFRVSVPPSSRDAHDDVGPESSGFDPVGWKQQLHAPAAALAAQTTGSATRQGKPQHFRIEADEADGAGQGSPDSEGAFGDATPAQADSELPASHDVSFVRDARRKALWRRPAVRAVLGLFSLVLAALLVLQFAFQQRDSLAASRPELKPALLALCTYLQCEVGPLRRIESVVIDSSSFNKTGADAYRLSFSLKNAGATPLAMPSLEVTLTDIQDQALIRRVLTPAQFGAAAGTLNAGADFSGAVAMKVSATEIAGTNAVAGPVRVAGYRMLAFYP